MNANMANHNVLPGHVLTYGQGEFPGNCSCGATSDGPLTSDRQRKVWHHAHKDEIRQQETPIEAPAPFPYMTVIEDRTPRRKVHESLGQAKKAVLFRFGGREDTLKTPCQVYKWTAAGWELLWKIKAGTKREAMPWLATESPKN